MNKNHNLFFIIFGLIILIAGLGISIYLVQRPQDPTSQAATGSACTQSPDCELLENPGNNSSHTTSRPIAYLDITAKDFHRFNSTSNDGCYNVQINSQQLSWERVGSGPDCKDISNIQIWFQPLSEPTTPPGEPTPTPPQQEKEHQVASCNSLSFSLIDSAPTNTPIPSPIPTNTINPAPTQTLTPTEPAPTIVFSPTPTLPPIGGSSESTPTPVATSNPNSTPTSPPSENPTATPTQTNLIAEEPTLPEVGNPLPTYIITAIGVLVISAALMISIL